MSSLHYVHIIKQNGDNCGFFFRVNASIHFQIEFFITECNWDHLYIFDGDSTEAPLLAAFK